MGDINLIADIIALASQQFSSKNFVNKLEVFILNNSKILDPIIDSLNSSLKLSQFELNFYEKNSPIIIPWIEEYNQKLNGNSGGKSNEYRLPTNIVPKKYTIKLTPFIEPGNFTFKGYVEIIANIVNSTNKVVLHIDDIKWETVALSINDKQIKVNSTAEDKKYHFMNITTSEQMIKGSQLKIAIEYIGNLNAEMRGFYRSSYIDDFNRTK